MPAVATLDDNIAAYENMRAQLESDYWDRWVVFYNGEMVGDYEDSQECAAETVKRFGRGPYLIRQVGATHSRLPSSVLIGMIDSNQIEPDNETETEDLEKLLSCVIKKSLSLEEIRKQRISFVMGMLSHDSTMTREQVQDHLKRHYG